MSVEKGLLAAKYSAVLCRYHKRWYKLPYSPLWFCLLIALIVRIWLVIHTHGVIDGDEALVGIQAERILHGEYPAYFYNQPYMGSLEAYLVALLFALAGPSVWALRAEPILVSLAIVWLTWKLAAALAQYAQLSPQSQRWFTTIAALFAAVPPLYDTVIELRALGGYVEAFLLMLLLLLSALQLTRRWRAGAAPRELAWRWAGIGLIIGLGLWVNPLLISAILAAAIWIVGTFFGSFRGVRKGHYVLLPALATIPACIIGLTPALLWGATHQWANVTYLLHAGSDLPSWPEIRVRYPNRAAIFFGLTQLYATCIAPRVIGGALPFGDSTLALLHRPTLVLGLFSILSTMGLVVLSFVWRHPLLLRIRRLAGLPLLFGVCAALIFCTTTTASSGLWSCNYDVAGRYATPLMLVLPFFVAAIFTVMSMGMFPWYPQRAARGRVASRNVGIPLVGIRCGGCQERGIRWGGVGAWLAYFRSQRMVQRVLICLLLIALVTQLYTYRLTDAGRTFQSPYCTSAPANDDLLIAYMQREHIRYAWANNWIAYPLDFKTHGSIIATDPLPLIRHRDQLNRIPAYTDAVEHADRPSMIVLVKRNDQYPLLLKLLDADRVTYRLARFPAEPGMDVLVVTPLSRTVSPFESGAFYAIFVCSG